MAKRKGKSSSGEGQFTITQINLDKKGKTNKKLKSNPMAAKYLTARGKELKELAAEYVKQHPPGSGKRKKKIMNKIEKKVVEKAS